MPNFAVIENGVVVNTILAPTLEVAVEVTGLLCVEFTDENPALIGDQFVIEETPAKTVK